MIENAQDWWETWETYRSQIISIAEDKLHYNMEEIQPALGDISLGTKLNEATLERDHTTIFKFVQYIWDSAPDAPVIHTWEGWPQLCELCSECHVLMKDLHDDPI